jgi:hypothetical protein
MTAALRTISALLALLLASVAIQAQQQSEPAPPPARPLLKQLNEETQSLYREVQAGVCRVQLPPPRWAGGPLVEQDNPAHKWAKQLDAAVREKLEDEQKAAKKGQYRRLTASVDPATTQAAATQPGQQQQGQSATQNAVGAWSMSTSGDGTLIFRPNGDSAGALHVDAGGGITRDGQIVAGNGRLNIAVAAAASFTPNNIALLLDPEGYLLVPIAVEKESFDADGIRCMVGPAQMATARFVGSDRQTNITLLKLDKPAGTPVKIAAERPHEGTLTMFLSPNSGVGRLMIWTNELRDWGVVVSMEGGVYGFVRQGQFLSAAGCMPAIDQLKRTGSVHRAKIGLGIAEIPQNDALRETNPVLGTQPAVRVNEIAPDSPAANAGLKVGDMILELNEQSVGDPHSFAAAITADAAKASVKLLREGREQTLTVRFTENP